jgi:exosome complex RNA-binding protein Rrp42 (RNase PH superfamily)
MFLQTDLLVLASGSSHLSLGGSEVVVGVKVRLIPPFPGYQGYIGF